jgi:carbon-monoxide dehydrogenase large subunit
VSTQTPHTVSVAWPRSSTSRSAASASSAPDVGGGFGPKARLYPEEIILAALALEPTVFALAPFAQHGAHPTQKIGRLSDAEISEATHLAAQAIEIGKSHIGIRIFAELVHCRSIFCA